MAENWTTTNYQGNSKSALSLALQGVTLASVLGGILAGGIWIGKIQTTLEEDTTRLKEISDKLTDSQNGVFGHLQVIDQRLKDLEETAKRLEGKIDQLSPKRVGRNSASRVDELKAQISALKIQLAKLGSRNQLSTVPVGAEPNENGRLREKLSQANHQLAEIASDLDAFSKHAQTKDPEVPERYLIYLEDNFERIQKKLEELRLRLES